MLLYVAKSLSFNPFMFVTTSPKLSTVLWISAVYKEWVKSQTQLYYYYYY